MVTAGQIPVSQQNYDLHTSSRCRLLAHKSVILRNNEHHLLVVDGGFGLFRTQLDGRTVQVADLNPYTVAFDLSKDFATTKVEPIWQIKKPYNGSVRPPIVNHGGLWASMDQNTILIHGGHFYHGDAWNSSAYYVSKSDIPEWELWKMDVRNWEAGWSDTTAQVTGHGLAIRTFAGTAASVANDTRQFWLGGLIDSTTSSTTPNNTMRSTNQMLELDEATNTVTRRDYYSPGSTDGYWQGDLIHLPIGSGKGYLISLMSLTHPTNTPWIDPDGDSGNYELGTNVTLDSIPLYDLETNTWFQQTADFYKNELPEPRTRFCSTLFHDAVDNTWHLWMHGGQKLSNQNEGVSDIYVLSMPSFTWNKVQTTLSSTNLIRSHTCHTMGGQLITVGGHPPGVDVATNVTCDTEYIKVLSISERSVAWDTFSTNTTYRTPLSIQNVTNGRRVPVGGFANDKLARDFNNTTTSALKSNKLHISIGGIVGVALGGLASLLAVALLYWYVRRRRHRRNPGPINGVLPFQTQAPADSQPRFSEDRDANHNHLTEQANKNPVIRVVASHEPDVPLDFRHMNQYRSQSQLQQNRNRYDSYPAEGAELRPVVRVSSNYETPFDFRHQNQDRLQQVAYSYDATVADDDRAQFERLRPNRPSQRSSRWLRSPAPSGPSSLTD